MDSPSSSSAYRRSLSRSCCAAYSRSSFAVCISFTLSLSVAAPDDPPARVMGGLAPVPSAARSLDGDPRVASGGTLAGDFGGLLMAGARLAETLSKLGVIAGDLLADTNEAAHLVHLISSTLIVYESYPAVKRSGAENPGVSQNRRAPSPFRNTVTTDIPRIACRSVGHH